ncbi:MAG: Nif11-like leader peptide family RiPP precursor [Clostridia bacterium]|jgi:predicted ribosomally synthesized peptide with nif11-like leader|nr:Nif11-like leader peptide family RiPP precursor [Clostridia bacterium]
MNEKFQRLVEMLNDDEQLAEKLMSQETPEEAQELLKGIGFEFSAAEILELRDALVASQLSDEELEGVAGGVGGNIDPFGVISWRGNRSRGFLPVTRIRIRIRAPRGW